MAPHPTSRRKAAAGIAPNFVGDRESSSELGFRGDHGATAANWTAGRLPVVASRDDKDNKDDKGLAFLTLDEVGIIIDCDGAIEAMFGYPRADLIFRHVSMLLPRLEDMELIQGGHLSSRLHYLCHVGLPFLVRPRDGEQFLGYLLLTDLSHPAEWRLRLSVRRS